MKYHWKYHVYPLKIPWEISYLGKIHKSQLEVNRHDGVVFNITLCPSCWLLFQSSILPFLMWVMWLHVVILTCKIPISQAWHLSTCKQKWKICQFAGGWGQLRGECELSVANQQRRGHILLPGHGGERCLVDGYWKPPRFSLAFQRLFGCRKGSFFKNWVSIGDDRCDTAFCPHCPITSKFIRIHDHMTHTESKTLDVSIIIYSTSWCPQMWCECWLKPLVCLIISSISPGITDTSAPRTMWLQAWPRQKWRIMWKSWFETHGKSWKITFGMAILMSFWCNMFLPKEFTPRILLAGCILDRLKPLRNRNAGDSGLKMLEHWI